MNHFHRIAKSRFGTWVKGHAKTPLIGPVIWAGARLIKMITHQMARMTPKHRAHDRQQAATLAAFERKIATQPAKRTAPE